jgi:serine/threonine-protein kinase
MDRQALLAALQQLDTLWANETMSDVEYAQERKALLRRLAALPEGAEGDSSASAKKTAQAEGGGALAADIFQTGYAAPVQGAATDIFQTGYAEPSAAYPRHLSETTGATGDALGQLDAQEAPSPPQAHDKVGAEALDLFSTGGGLPPSEEAIAPPAMQEGQRERTGQSVTPVAEKIAGRYLVVRELGRGGMGSILQALDLQSQEQRALKFLHGHLDESRALFQQEIQALLRLRHAHIVRFHDIGRDAKRGFFFAMDYLEGESFQSLLEQAKAAEDPQPLPLPDLLDAIEQIASALDHAHQQGLLHLDIKPANLLWSKGRAYLIDFGIAKLRALHAQSTLGTVYYMAPEQLSGDAPLSPATDLYALAVVVYQMLTGKLFQGGMPAPSQMIPSLPHALDTIHEKAIAWPPQDRFQRASAYAQALRQAFQKTRRLEQPPPSKSAAQGSGDSWQDRIFAPQQQGQRLRHAPTQHEEESATAPPAVDIQQRAAGAWPTIRQAIDKKRPRWLQTPFARKPPKLAPLASLSDNPESLAAKLGLLPRPDALFLLDREGQPLLELCAIPQGRYRVGADKRDKSARRHEKPSQEVALSGFWIARAPITHAIWQRFLLESGFSPSLQESHEDYLKSWRDLHFPKGMEHHPVTHLSALHAWAFCDFYGLSLPSEAQWEAALRGQQALPYPWGAEPPPSIRERGINTCANLGRLTPRTTAIHEHPDGVSPFGLLDGIGNARQWVADEYDALWLSRLEGTDPILLHSDRARFQAVRGCDSTTDPALAQAYRRQHESPEACLPNLSFRPTLDLAP